MSTSHSTLLGAGNCKSAWTNRLVLKRHLLLWYRSMRSNLLRLQRQQAAGNSANANLLHAVVVAQAGGFLH